MHFQKKTGHIWSSFIKLCEQTDDQLSLNQTDLLASPQHRFSKAETQLADLQMFFFACGETSVNGHSWILWVHLIHCMILCANNRVSPAWCANFKILRAIKVEHQIQTSSLWSHIHLQAAALLCLILAVSLLILIKLLECAERLREWEKPFITLLICDYLCMYICRLRIHTMCKSLQMSPKSQHILKETDWMKLFSIFTVSQSPLSNQHQQF